jgi:hypothetical protein
MKQLTIEHNHGVVILKDAYLVEEKGTQYAKGICIGGGSTSRLFHATSYRPFDTGVEMLYPCHRTPWCSDEALDQWQVSVVLCG